MARPLRRVGELRIGSLDADNEDVEEDVDVTDGDGDSGGDVTDGDADGWDGDGGVFEAGSAAKQTVPAADAVVTSRATKGEKSFRGRHMYISA